VVFEKKYIIWCSSAEWIARNGVPWDDAIVMAAAKLRKLWDSLSELRSSVCERRLERTVLRPAPLPVKTAQFTQFYPSIMTSHSKIAQFNWECIGRFRQCVCLITEPRALLCECKGKWHSWLLCQQFLALRHSWQDYVSEIRRHKLLKLKCKSFIYNFEKIDLCKLNFWHQCFTLIQINCQTYCTRKTIHPTYMDTGEEQFEQVNSFNL
jgi:hypothetical protein